MDYATYHDLTVACPIMIVNGHICPFIPKRLKSRQFENCLLFPSGHFPTDTVQCFYNEDTDKEADNIHPQIIYVAFADIKEILARLDRSGKQDRDQVEDPSAAVVPPQKAQIETKGRENQEISEELYESAVSEGTFADQRPVYGESTPERYQMEASSGFRRGALEDEEIQKERDVDQEEYDARAQKAVAEGLSDM